MCIAESEVKNVVEEYRSLQALEYELSDRISYLKKQISDYMQENGLEVENGDNFTITYKDRTRTSFDSKLLESVFGSEIGKYRKSSTYKVLQIK